MARSWNGLGAVLALLGVCLTSACSGGDRCSAATQSARGHLADAVTAQARATAASASASTFRSPPDPARDEWLKAYNACSSSDLLKQAKCHDGLGPEPMYAASSVNTAAGQAEDAARQAEQDLDDAAQIITDDPSCFSVDEVARAHERIRNRG